MIYVYQDIQRLQRSRFMLDNIESIVALCFENKNSTAQPRIQKVGLYDEKPDQAKAYVIKINEKDHTEYISLPLELDSQKSKPQVF